MQVVPAIVLLEKLEEPLGLEGDIHVVGISAYVEFMQSLSVRRMLALPVRAWTPFLVENDPWLFHVR